MNCTQKIKDAFSSQKSTIEIVKYFKNERGIFLLVLVGFCFVGLAVGMFVWQDYSLSLDYPIKADKIGQFGDFVGGVVGSIWALAGVLLFYVALRDQRSDNKISKDALVLQTKALEKQVEEFELQRDEIKKSRIVYEQQSKTLILQQFTSNFYSLLDLYRSLKNTLNNTGTSTNYIMELVDEVMAVEYTIVKKPLELHAEYVHNYTKLFNSKREELSHYFKCFYRILKVIDSESGLDETDKWSYAKVLRSQLTDSEQLLLFFNAHSIFGIKARPLFLKYNLLKHVPLFCKPEFSFYQNLQGDEILNFTAYLRNFITDQVNSALDTASEGSPITEIYDEYNCLVGIDPKEKIDLTLTVPEDLGVSKFKLTEDQLACFLNLVVNQVMVIDVFFGEKQVAVTPFRKTIDGELILGNQIEISEGVSLKLIEDIDK